ncbi:hypothetical protein HLK59_29270 [Streptomyces sp. S3(2020)]|uniref:hypothetical protein n=1 Tax=Streptomyces sp. S3(2020) TaxID=2732044 RepID=UPI0014881D24|nr:hypothetical protein [Streptomyces sp. S3(2020)]NNN34382.1 hypothetical protein [Streptomyces sp. S3(2020)]
MQNPTQARAYVDATHTMALETLDDYVSSLDVNPLDTLTEDTREVVTRGVRITTLVRIERIGGQQA